MALSTRPFSYTYRISLYCVSLLIEAGAKTKLRIGLAFSREGILGCGTTGIESSHMPSDTRTKNERKMIVFLYSLSIEAFRTFFTKLLLRMWLLISLWCGLWKILEKCSTNHYGILFPWETIGWWWFWYETRNLEMCKP